MTNNEAISRIKFLLDVGGSDGFSSADIEALNMAINALSAQIAAPPKSNADRIRQMTDEELAEWLTDGLEPCNMCASEYCCGMESNCVDGVLLWLRQEVSEDASD